MIKASRHTLLANVVQQFCAGLLLLFLPNILGKMDYAQVVFVSVLLSFIGFADAGMSQAYGRIVPSLLAQERHDEVRIWDATTLRFGLIFSCFYSLIIAFIFYHRYENITRALLLLPMPFIMFYYSFHITRFSSAGYFRQYRIVNSWRAVASLLAFPLVLMLGITGFFISNLLSAIIALFSIGKELFKPLGKPHWLLVKNHLPEGIILALTGVLWMTLMNFSRFYASISYKPEDIATYGIISAAGMSLLSLVVSLFIPVAVELRSRHAKSEIEAFEFVDTIISRSLPWMLAATLAAIITAPTFFRLCFPKYHIDSEILTANLLGIAFFSFLSVYANFLIARKQFFLYLLFVVISLTIGIISAFAIDNYFPIHGAAYGQLIGIIAYTILLFWKVSDFTNAQNAKIWQKQAVYLVLFYIFCGLVIIFNIID